MKKTLVIYWSGTGNTEAMANAVVDGMKEAGADVTCWTVDDVKADAVAEFDAVAMGCPAMGAEVLEETEFDPMYQSIKASCPARPWVCSAPTAGATANGCAIGKTTSRPRAASSSVRASSAAKRPTTRRLKPARRSASCSPNKRKDENTAASGGKRRCFFMVSALFILCTALKGKRATNGRPYEHERSAVEDEWP